MLQLNEDVISKAHDVVATSQAKPAGYRLKIFPLGVDSGLKAGEKQKYATLAKLGFQAATEDQAERETKGAETAIIVEAGKAAWSGPHLESHGAWAKEGQVIKYLRYAGHEFQDPPGSGVTYRLINDEDVLGYYEECVA